MDIEWPVDDVRTAIRKYFDHPDVVAREIPAPVENWVRDTILASRPDSADLARDRCCLLSYFGEWYYAENGTCSDPIAEMLSTGNRTAYVNSSHEITYSSAPTYKSNLKRVLTDITKPIPPVDPKGRRPGHQTAAKPYTVKEQDLLYKWCVDQDQRSRRLDGQAIYGLAFGVGACLQDLDSVVAVVQTAAGLEVTFGKHVQRSVLCLPGSAYEALLAAYLPDRTTPFATEPDRTGKQAYRALYTAHRRFLDDHARDPENVPPWFNFDRTRSTWFVQKILASTRLDILVDEAGVATATLQRYLQFVRIAASQTDDGAP